MNITNSQIIDNPDWAFCALSIIYTNQGFSQEDADNKAAAYIYEVLSQSPSAGRRCSCEDAPCCGCYS